MAYIDYGGCDYGGFYGECDYGECYPNPNPYPHPYHNPYPNTTIYKAGFSTLDDLYILVTKIITKYPVLTTYKILKNSKKNISNFFLFLRIL